MSKIWLENDIEDVIVCGIDEAGRGPLAGPCVVSGVVLPKGYTHPLINDSKQLSEKQRKRCFDDILRDALWVMVITVSPETIDKDNIYQATKNAMKMIAKFSDAKIILSDAMPFQIEGKEIRDYIKGDSRSISIAAASIIAKVTRDTIMEEYDQLYPEYGFRQHKGYPTKKHVEALHTFGILPIHRLSYEPVKTLSQKTLFD
ncbi:MAG TPA: ribonuclease HII [Erysipelotrichaceae bacterium]|nr:ribonuclease HII [Erysipelotrichaceae bacterium]